MSAAGRKKLKTFDDRTNRCINCSYCIPRNQHKHSLDQAPALIVNILQLWITPTELPPGSIICDECFILITNRVNSLDEEDDLPSSSFGHKSVCFPCGKSILRSQRTYPVPDHGDRQERTILQQLVLPHLVSRMERVCAACWRSASREAQRQQHHEPNISSLTDGSLAEYGIPEPPPIPPLAPQTTQQIPTIPKITSSLYKRAANTSSHCLFINCFDRERLLIPKPLKELLLYRYKFYIPPSARICRHHLDNGPWSELTSELRDFTGQQFDNIMSMMQRIASYQLDFTNISLMPNHLCHYWLGMDSDQFNNLLKSIPNLAEEVPNPTLALCVYVVKMRTGDSNEKLAILFNKPRSTLERYMAKVKNCLNTVDFPS